MNICINDKIFGIISDVVSAESTEAYVIGGWVRDCLLNREHSEKDIDIVVIGNGIELARKTAKKINPDIRVIVFRNFGTAMFRWANYEIEFVGARKESYRPASRKPVVENGSLEDDQKRRDFTINALAISLNKDTYGELLDPFGGRDDLRRKIIRTPLDPGVTFSDDPLRMIRAVRFATQLGFSIVTPLLVCILTAVWLRDELGGWVLIPGILLGLGGAISAGPSFCRQVKGADPGKEQPPVPHT